MTVFQLYAFHNEGTIRDQLLVCPEIFPGPIAKIG
jgi:hypothetical protein